MLNVGDVFPSFQLPDQDGNVVDSESLKKSSFVVYFYPKDDTPGCTTEACEFQEKWPSSDGVRLFGVSPDSPKSHRKFADKFGLKFTLLADEQHVLAEACGVWVEKSMYGKKYMGVERTTFVVDASGVVVQVYAKVKPAGHASEVIGALG